MIHLGNPSWIHALWVIPASALLLVYAADAQRRLRLRFAHLEMLPALTARARVAMKFVKGLLLIIGLASVVVALMRPQWHEREIPVTRRGREVVFLVDVSRSMLAKDLAPNRLERAKIWIRDLSSSLEGDTVGLVAFAGVPVIKCPLTHDLGFFDMALEQLGPNEVPRGGTMIGDAIRKTMDQVFEHTPDDEPEPGQFRDIILITDGEDQGSLPVEAARAAADAGVRILALGIGSESQGAPIPTGEGDDGFVTYEGKTVRSRLNVTGLAEIAQATPGGVFLKVGTGDLDLRQVYQDLIASAGKTALESQPIVKYDEAFWIFLLVSLVCLMTEPVLNERGRMPA